MALTGQMGAVVYAPFTSVTSSYRSRWDWSQLNEFTSEYKDT
jgi:hypothetical protein